MPLTSTLVGSPFEVNPTKLGWLSSKVSESIASEPTSSGTSPWITWPFSELSLMVTPESVPKLGF
ncbi:hypothetical protein CTN07_08300 [Photobacterium damselae]|nr:hypothetical protein CTN07_08300 [Photobacterium damselae]